jgi:hypothetical protein
MFDRVIEGPSAWRRRDIAVGDYLVPLSAACRDEIRRVADEMRAHPLPAIVRSPDDFDWPACRAAMQETRRILASGVGFAVVDRLPLDDVGRAEAVAIYWLLAAMVARPVAQKLDGTLIYDVLDTGAEALPGSGVRPDKTSIEIKFHNDNAYNATPPDAIALFCLRTAKSGGLSRVASFHTLHNRLREAHPTELARLYRPFWFDRQREFHPGESPVFAAPVFEAGDRVRARYSTHQIRGGYALRQSQGGAPIDNEGAAALAAMLDLFDDPDLSFDFALEPGQIEFADNRALGHARTEFEDHPEPGRRRHLVRLWLRDGGRRAYQG